MRLSEQDALQLAARAFERAGVPKTGAAAAAEILTIAQMMGLNTHGLSRVATYRDRMKVGGITASAVATITATAPSIRTVDGANALGPAVALQSLYAAIEVAETQGAAVVLCRNANHLGALAPYLFLASRAGMASIITSNTAPMIAAEGGQRQAIGNNPLGIGLPNPGGAPVLLDMSMSVVSRSRVRAMAAVGETIPETWATDINGRPTTDPAKALEGLMQAIGGAKGSRLALCLDLLAGGLSGAAMLSAIPNSVRSPEKPQNLGQMFVLIDTRKIMDPEELSHQMRTASESLSNSGQSDPNQPIRFPGARAMAAFDIAREKGLEITPALFNQLTSLAAD